MGQVVSDTELGEGGGMDTAPVEAEFVEFVAAHQRRLLGFAYLLTGDRFAAEDLVQDALARAFLNWRRVRQRERAEAYVRKIILNEHRSVWRRAWKRLEQPRAAPPDASAFPAPDLETRDALWQLVLSLPDRQRAVVVLRHLEDLSEAETAEVLGISVGTVKSQTSRALARLRQQVAESPGLLRGVDDE